jgi:Family of unknown function (DUF5519)
LGDPIKSRTDQLKQLREHVAAWPNISIQPHRFGGTEFGYKRAEVGHVFICEFGDNNTAASSRFGGDHTHKILLSL